MKKVLRIFISGLLGLLVAASVALAQEVELEEIVVTATRLEKPLAEAPGSVSVIKKEDIERRDVKTVDEALNTIPGVFNRRTKGLMDTLASVTLRGIPGVARTLILVDGITLNDAYGGRPSFGGLLPEDVERIEVVRGPFSSLYGGYAMGGVVNIITKMPQKREFSVKSGYGLSWKRGESMDDLRMYHFSYGDRIKDKLSLLLSYGYKDTGGYVTALNVSHIKPPEGVTGWSHTTDTEGKERYLIGTKGGDNTWWEEGITLKAGYDFSGTSKINLSFMRTHYRYDYDEPHTYLKDAAGKPVWKYTGIDIEDGKTKTLRESSFLSGSGERKQNLYSLSYEGEFSPVKVKLSFGLADTTKSWYTTPGWGATRAGGDGKVVETPSESYNADLQFTIPLLGRHVLTAGGSFRHGWADAKEHKLTDWRDEGSKTHLIYNSKGKDRTYALFVQNETMIFDNLTTYLGFRQDWWKTYDGYVIDIDPKTGLPKKGFPKEYESRSKSAFSPKASVVYKPFERTTLRASLGRAFRPPTIYDLYRTWMWVDKVYAGNPDLKPETTTSWDIGVEQKLWKGAKANATYFENHMKDLIYRKTVTPTYLEWVNVGKAKSSGIEFEVKQRFAGGLKLFSNFTYTDSEIKDNPAKPQTVAKKLTMLPERMFNIGGEFEKGPFLGSIIGRYVSKRWATDENKDVVNNVYGSYDPYFVTDLKVSYKLAKWLVASFSVDNIFNKKYFDYYKAPGRSWFGELTVRF